MSLTPDHPWYWVEKNRQYVSRRRSPRSMRSVGIMALDMFAKKVQRAEVRARVAECIAGVVDGEFRSHCTLGLLKSSRVAILVDQEGLVHHMRLKWHFTLLQRLQSSELSMRICSIEFKAGESPHRFQPLSLVAGKVHVTDIAAQTRRMKDKLSEHEYAPFAGR